jgi:signal transduction histidine kinase
VPGDELGPRSLRQLLDAVVLVGSDLDLHAVLRRIVEAAVSLVDARYGALGVLDETGTGLADFITVGVDEATHEAIGGLPKGLGLLGSLITDARPLRAAQLQGHPDSAGFPPHHPPMTSFLGVPIRIRQEVFGNLYLTDKTTAGAFTDVDEQLALGLASSAAVAIDNARLFGQIRQREEALTAMQAVTTTLLAGLEPNESLRAVARYARRLLRADLATIALPAGRDSMVLAVVDGELGQAQPGEHFARPGSIAGEVLATGHPLLVENLGRDPRVRQPQVRVGTLGPGLFVALEADGQAFGVLSLSRHAGREGFAVADLDLAASFAAQASVVLKLERSRQNLQRLALLEDQERIARDLHDSVIQRLFATGLALQGAARLVTDAEARRRIEAAVDELDVTVRHIRTVIFDVERSRVERPEGVRGPLIDLLREAARTLGFEPRVSFAGPVDTLVPVPVTAELLATVREALSNVARHARASHVDVDVAVGDDIVVVVTDDGVGIHGDGTSGGRGLDNMATRARRLGGDFRLEPGTPAGTRLEWRVPL